MSRHAERGVALLAAVVALGVLGVLAVGLAYTSAVDQHLTRNGLAALQADALARSAAAAAATLLAERDAADVDWPGAPWAAGSGRQPLGAGTVEAAVEDEARRLAINLPELAGARARLFATLGVGADVADAVADWIDPDDVPAPLGAERAYYLGLTPPYAPRNAPLTSVGELGLVRGMTLEALARVAPFITVASEPRVNPNTAPREVLLAVTADPTSTDRLLAARRTTPIDPDRDLDTILAGTPDDKLATLHAQLTARAMTYTVHTRATVGDLTRTWDATIVAPPGLDADLVAWRQTRP